MRITIAERLKPFSMTPGTFVVIPNTSLKVQIFPALIRLYDISAALDSRDSLEDILEQVAIPLHGPVKDFTVQLDLEKNLILVWGHYKEGYLRYRIEARPTVQIVVEKFAGISCGADITNTGDSNCLNINGVARNLSFSKIYQGQTIDSTERLSLGSHKKQDWDLVRRRSDLTEIFPVWVRLGSLLPSIQLFHTVIEPNSLLSACADSLQDKRNVAQTFLNLFNAGFDGILTPRQRDTDYLGFDQPLGGAHPLQLLISGASLIRSLFITQEKNQIAILPTLPPEFHCGRYTGLVCREFGVLDIEWSKKRIRRMVFRAKSSTSLTFIFSKNVKSFRLNTGRKISEAITINAVNTNDVVSGSGQYSQATIDIEAGKEYFFDRFFY